MSLQSTITIYYFNITVITNTVRRCTQHLSICDYQMQVDNTVSIISATGDTNKDRCKTAVNHQATWPVK